MLSDNRHADTKAKPGAAPGTLGRKERTKNSRQRLPGDADAVILECHQHPIANDAQTNAERALFSNLPDGLLGVDDEIQKDLRQLVRVAEPCGKVRPCHKIRL